MHADHAPIFRVRTPLLALALVLSAGAASAQWMWVDAQGHKVYSDTPPPATVADKDVLKRPGAPAVSPGTEAAEGTQNQAAASKPAPDVPPGRDDQLEARKKQAEAAEAAKRRAEQEQVAKARAENCERAKRAKATLASGVRIATTNAKGEREIMDDQARATEGKRLDQIVASDCGPMPAAR